MNHAGLDKEEYWQLLWRTDEPMPSIFLKINNTNSHALLNRALEPNLINPNTATEEIYINYPLLETEGYLTPEGVKTQLIKRQSKTRNKIACVDWITVTMSDMTFADYTTKQSNEFDRQTSLIKNVSDFLKDIIGFGVEQENKSGRNFYERSFNLEHDTGFVCIGGQKNTISITINGTGCTFGKLGWEQHFFEWLSVFSYNVKITRIDLAHDDFDGIYDLDFFDQQDSIRGFSFGSGRPPTIEKRGNWKRPNGKGRTLYIGSNQSSKLTRIYEKGKQLGNPDSLWVRTEVQFRSNDYLIELDVLVSPDKYFLASYPCFHVFDDEQKPEKLQVIEKEQLITFTRALEITKRQFGRYIHFFRNVYQDDKLTLDILTDIKDKSVPERIDLLTIPKMLHKDYE